MDGELALAASIETHNDTVGVFGKPLLVPLLVDLGLNGFLKAKHRSVSRGRA